VPPALALLVTQPAVGEATRHGREQLQPIVLDVPTAGLGGWSQHRHGKAVQRDDGAANDHPAPLQREHGSSRPGR